MKKMRWESHMEKELASKVEKGSIKTHLHKNFFKRSAWDGKQTSDL
jgi:hypothetical protein